MNWTEEITSRLEPWVQRTIDNLPTSRRRTVLGFLQCLCDDGAGNASIQNYVNALRALDGGKPYKRLAERDIRAWARDLDARYAPKTAWLYKFNVKRFLKWIYTNRLDGDEYPKCVAWIKYKRVKANYGGEVLSFEEIKQLVDAASNERDRAMIFALYETGARASELAMLKIKDIEFNQHGAAIRLGREHGKTGERRVLVHECVPNLKKWLNKHPLIGNPEAPLWPSERTKNQPIQRHRLINLVKKCAKRAGLNKVISPHSFRHARATHLSNILKEPQMRVFFGWAKNSDMPSVYVHLSGRDVDGPLLEYWGLKPRKHESQDSPLKKKVCPRCNMENPASARFCWRCWAAFDIAKAEELTAQALEILMGMVDPAQFREKLKEKGLAREDGKRVDG